MVKDVVERQARSSRARLDAVMHDRRRKDALTRLGEAVYELAGRGELGDLVDHPELAELLATVENMDMDDRHGDMPGDPGRDFAGHEQEAVSSAEWSPPRHRYHEPGGEFRVWRPTMPEDEPGERPRPRDDGRPRGQGSAPAPARRAEPESRPGSPTRGERSRPQRGGIVFASDGTDDDDLSQYMNEDDVPRRGKGTDDGNH